MLVRTFELLDNMVSNVEQERMCPDIFLMRQRRSPSFDRGLTSRSCVQRCSGVRVRLLRSLYSQTDSLLRRPASRGDNLRVACLQVLLEPRGAAVDIRRKARPPFTVDSGRGIENHHGNGIDQVELPGSALAVARPG